MNYDWTKESQENAQLYADRMQAEDTTLRLMRESNLRHLALSVSAEQPDVSFRRQLRRDRALFALAVAAVTLGIGVLVLCLVTIPRSNRELRRSVVRLERVK